MRSGQSSPGSGCLGLAAMPGSLLLGSLVCSRLPPKTGQPDRRRSPDAFKCGSARREARIVRPELLLPAERQPGTDLSRLLGDEDFYPGGSAAQRRRHSRVLADFLGSKAKPWPPPAAIQLLSVSS